MRPKSCRPSEVERVVLAHGFFPIRQRGSHAVYKNPKTGRRTIVYFHPGDSSIGNVRDVIDDLEMTVEQFNAEV
jgi:predicted RNA binding protein YcfA (HicA-like mRNA interferase family)